MILTYQHNMAFSRNEQYLNSGQYTDPIWDLPQSTGSSTIMNSRTPSGLSDMSPFASLRKSVPPGFSSISASANDFSSADSSYNSSFNNAYSPSVFGGSRNDREFPRAGSPLSGPSGLSALSHSSSSGGLSNSNFAMGYNSPAASSRPLTASNGAFSRSISVGQTPSVSTSGFGSSYPASSFTSQYSVQPQSQSSLNNTFNMNALKAGFDDLSIRNSLLKRTQEAKRSTSTMGVQNFGTSPFMRGSAFNSTNDILGSDGPMFDISEFPSLSSRSRLENSMSFANVLSQGPKSAYGLTKQGGSDGNTEFQMHSEDFPALPGAEGGSSLPAFEKEKNRGMSGDSSGDRATPNSASVSSGIGAINQQFSYGLSSSAAAAMNTYFQPGPGLSQGMLPFRKVVPDTADRLMSSVPSVRRRDDIKDILPSSGSRNTFVPPSIIQDHFGLFGYLQYMKCWSANASVPLASVGCDLHSLGLVFNPLDATPKRFKGYPFLHSYINEACTAHICHLDVDVPAEYLVSINMPKDKVTLPRITKFSEDLLFYLFYGFQRD
ncbi:CCR4-NOT transcription complex subunit 2-like [Paramacrobiotus metropolitanus]|uniref:CCR4-NOT transcription complex subunit 2-like n=1 Tax=Paramacrobiotus metropolitanus TaxID=2943436 RepID=UPI0024459CCC|nr:CCR4-NOT transcription complex subunit 2-like [Paramacrobiotus metropolitanus]